MGTDYITACFAICPDGKRVSPSNVCLSTPGSHSDQDPYACSASLSTFYSNKLQDLCNSNFNNIQLVSQTFGKIDQMPTSEDLQQCNDFLSGMNKQLNSAQITGLVNNKQNSELKDQQQGLLNATQCGCANFAEQIFKYLVDKTEVQDDDTLCTYAAKKLLNLGMSQIPVIGDICEFRRRLEQKINRTRVELNQLKEQLEYDIDQQKNQSQLQNFSITSKQIAENKFLYNQKKRKLGALTSKITKQFKTKIIEIAGDQVQGFVDEIFCDNIKEGANQLFNPFIQKTCKVVSSILQQQVKGFEGFTTFKTQTDYWKPQFVNYFCGFQLCNGENLSCKLQKSNNVAQSMMKQVESVMCNANLILFSFANIFILLILSNILI